MNNLKFAGRSGKVGFVRLKQERNFRTHPFHGERWASPAQEKARILSNGGQLLGVRQK